MIERNVSDLQCGYNGRSAKWTWRPVGDRRGDDLRSWQELFASIEREGIRDPLIAYGDRVLWGMRRLEIARILDILSVHVLEMVDDPGGWNLEDVRAFRRRMAL